MSPIKIVFFGTSEVSCPALKKLLNNKSFFVEAVVSQPDRKVGRKQILETTAVKRLALEYNIPVFQPEKLNKEIELISYLKNLKVDFFVVVAYGQILSQEVLDIPIVAPVNIHFSLLPKYRGASPVASAILNGDNVAGVSFIKMTLGMDEGPIYFSYWEYIFNLNKNELTSSLARSSAAHLANLLIDIKELNIIPVEQDSTKATYCGKFFHKDMEIDPVNCSAENILCKIKAFPGEIFITFKGKKIKLLKCTLYPLQGIIHAGQFNIFDGKLILTTIHDAVEILELQIEGKIIMTAKECLNGNSKLFI